MQLNLGSVHFARHVLKKRSNRNFELKNDGRCQWIPMFLDVERKLPTTHCFAPSCFSFTAENDT